MRLEVAFQIPVDLIFFQLHSLCLCSDHDAVALCLFPDFRTIADLVANDRDVVRLTINVNATPFCAGAVIIDLVPFQPISMSTGVLRLVSEVDAVNRISDHDVVSQEVVRILVTD